MMKSKLIFKKMVFFAGVLFFQAVVAGNVFSAEKVKFAQVLSAELEQPVDVAVSESGDKYVLDKKLSRVFMFRDDGKLIKSFGEKGTEMSQFLRPEGLALSIRGEVIVADTGNHRVQVFKPNGHFLYELGNVGNRPGEFKAPNSVALNILGNIFVTDASQNTLSMFSPSGVYLKRWSLDNSPTDMAFDNAGQLYILFNEIKKVVLYTPQLKKVKEFALEGRQFSKDIDVKSITVDHRGDLYLIDHTSHKIVKVDQDNQLLFSFGSHGDGKGQFDDPSGIVSDSEGFIYVADLNNKRVQKLHVSGSQKEAQEKAKYTPAQLDYETSVYVGRSTADINYIQDYGLFALNDYKGQVLVKKDDAQRVYESDDSQWKLKNPKALYVYKSGRILVADSGNHRLQFLNTDGTHNYQFGRKGSDTSEFHTLAGVAVDKRGYVFVADTNNHRIQVFNEDGIYLSSYGIKSEGVKDAAAEPGTFLQPKDLAFNSRDELHVLDHGNKRIQIFSRDGEFISQIPKSINEKLFDDPVDIAIDENDNIFVADRGEHAVKMLDAKGNLLMQFGSAGKGRSYFPQLSSITSHGGKIYVADYLVDKVQVFRYNNKEKNEDEYFMLTRISKPLRMENASESIRLNMSRKLLLADLKKEFTEKIGILEEDLEGAFKIEEEIVMGNGLVQMTISVPKNIIPKKYTVIGMR